MRDFSIDLIWAKIQMAITGIGGWLGYFVGGVDGLMTTLIIDMISEGIYHRPDHKEAQEEPRRADPVLCRGNTRGHH